ncbi:MAG: VWD domain-containing protein [Deltaproteobacteria bacterium]
MHRFTRLALVFLIACDPTGSTTDDDAPPPPGPACETPLTGVADASPDVRDATGVARYTYTVELGPDDFTVRSEDDAGTEIGRLTIASDRALTDAFDGQASERYIGRVFIRYTDGDGSVDFTLTHFMGDMPIANRLLEIEHDGRSLFIEAPIDEAERPDGRRTLMVREADVATAPTTGYSAVANLPIVPGRERALEGVYALRTEGSDTTAAEAWAAEVGLTGWNDSATLRRALLMLADGAWSEAIVDHVERCATDDGTSSGLIGRTARGINVVACTEAALAAGGALGFTVAAFVAAPSIIGAVFSTSLAVASQTLAVVKFAECGCTNSAKVLVGCGAGCDPGACHQACAFEALGCDASTIVTSQCRTVMVTEIGGFQRQACGCEVTEQTNECDVPSIIQDPHVETFDGLRYDLQGSGEFVAVEAFEGAPFVVQVRMEPYRERTCDGVSTNTAMATQMGDHRVSLYVVQGDLRVVIDDAEVDLPIGDNRRLDDGVVQRIDDDEIWLTWPDGSRVTMRGIDVFFELDPALQARVRGLIGTANGDEEDEIVLRSGETIPYPVTFDDVHDRLADSWRISPSESLFTYANGEDTSTFTDRSFPPTYHDVTTLDPEDVATARAACEAAGVTDRVLMEDCILDVVCAGADAGVYANLVGGPRVPVSRPAGLEGWIPIGDGEWFQSESRVRLVDTATAPEFLVSAVAYDAFQLTARFNVTSASSGYAGFLLGLASPTAEGEPIDAYLLSWKGPGDDDWDGATAREGFTFARVDGAFDATRVREQLWAQVESPSYQVLDRSNGAGLGFDGNYEVQLTYAPDRIEITVRDDDDDSVVYDVAVAPTAGTFPARRLGLYALRQAWVGMSQVELVRF